MRVGALDLPAIASAPKDGSLIVAFAWWKGEWREVGPARFVSDASIIAEPAWVHDEHRGVLEPTHWLPWPNPPSEASVTAIEEAA